MATSQEYDRDWFIKKWAETILKVPCDVYSVSAALVTRNRNFPLAVSILFGLSFKTHKDWINDCAKHWKDALPEGSVIDAEYCQQFQQYYINEVVAYPADA